jgi:recombination protein RecT
MNEVATTPQAEKFPAMLEKFKGEIARALPRHLSGDRMARIALTAFRRNPGLAKCDPRSVFAAVIQAAQLGLEPDTLGRSYLIPYGGECQFVPGWKGLVDLVNRAGNAAVWTGAVFDGDEFDYALGDKPFIEHRPGTEDDPNLLRYVYAVGRVKGSEWPVIEVWTMAKIWKHRDRYNKVGQRHYSYKEPEMYARKVPLLQVLKYMPASPELALAMALDHAATAGEQRVTVQEAIDGTFVERPTDGAPPAEAGETKGTEKKGAERPPLPAEDFAASLPGWQEAIAKKKKTAEQLIETIGSKWTLTDEQKAAIRTPAPAAS